MLDPHRIFIGFDHRQWVSLTALATSIIERTSHPVSITPLILGTLPIGRTGLTPFTYSRFLVPWLCGFKGTAAFFDCDQVLLGDPAELFALADDAFAVQIVADPDYRFEWASVMLFNCGHPDNAVLTPDYIDDPARCRAPHLIDWTKNVGGLPREWNHLVGYQAPKDAKLVHYTQGVPAYPETEGSEHADAWHRSAKIAMSTLPWLDLMGPSVHTKTLGDGRVVPKLYREDAA